MNRSGKKGRIVCAVLGVMLAAAILFLMLHRNFDAAGYTEALLGQTFQGETEALAAFDGENSTKELEQQYESYIHTFSESLIEGLNAGSEMSAKFDTLCREIFRLAKYSVREAEKIHRDEYRVTVEIVPMNVLVNWKQSLAESMQEINAKVERGEYKGTQEEILEAMLWDITTQSYGLLETAYQEADFGEAETATVTVRKSEKGKFGISDAEISDLVAKILRLDVIQD